MTAERARALLEPDSASAKRQETGIKTKVF
jgi:hypothetical protein